MEAEDEEDDATEKEKLFGFLQETADIPLPYHGKRRVMPHCIASRTVGSAKHALKPYHFVVHDQVVTLRSSPC